MADLIKRTPARRKVMEFLSNSNAPVDILDIYAFLKKEKLSTNKVTVYRIIDFLHTNGIIERLEFGEGKFRYEIKKGDHHHLVCKKCGSVADIEDKFMHSLEKEIYETKGFIVKNHSMEFFGICKNCQL